jgi:hypothetical protein
MHREGIHEMSHPTLTPLLTDDGPEGRATCAQVRVSFATEAHLRSLLQ